MPNPSTGWNQVPVFGFYFQGDDVTPVGGSVRLSFTQRVTRVDGRVIYPSGATVTRQIGNHEQDPITRDAVRDAWRTADEAVAIAAGETFDSTAWNARWNVLLTGAVFASFPAADDPDIIQTGYQVKVEETLNSGGGKVYFIEPLLADLDQVPPGINLGLVEVPPGSPTVPAPIYAKGLPGGVASLDSGGKVPVEQLPEGLGGDGGGDALHPTDTTGVHGIADTTALVVTTDARLGDTRTPTDGSVTAVKLGDSAVVNRAINDGAVTDAKVSASNKDGAAGTPSMRTLGTGAQQAAAGNDSRLMSEAERTKLAGVQSGATANDSDTNLRARSSHTGSQAISTVTGLQAALDAKASAAALAAAQLLTANNQTGTAYTLVLADAGKVVERNNAAANTTTVPPNSSVAFPVGTVVEVWQQGVGTSTVAAGAGVTFTPADVDLTLEQGLSVSLRKRATNEWAVISPGDAGGGIAKADGVGVVFHGTNANMARPTGYASIMWIGSVDPANAVDGTDTWLGPDA